MEKLESVGRRAVEQARQKQPREKLPNLELVDEEGAPFQPATTDYHLWIFFLGSFSPCCKAQLEAFALQQGRLQRAGLSCYFVSPQSPEQNGLLKQELETGWPLLSDAASTAARALGVGLELQPEDFDVFTRLGVFPTLYYAQAPFRTAVPSLFLADDEGRIIRSWIQESLWRRVDPDTVLEVLDKWRQTN